MANETELEDPQPRKVLLIPDTTDPPWAWCWMAQSIRKYAPPDYEVTIKSVPEIGSHAQLKNWRRKWDGVLSMAWFEHPHPKYRRNMTLVADHGLEYQCGSDWLEWRRITASCHNNADRARSELPKFDGALAVNPQLAQTARQYLDEVHYCPAGVDAEFFYPQPFRKHDRLVVGWCGKAREDHRNTKGYHEILKPLVQSGLDVEWRLNTHSAHDAMTREAMREWYWDIDVFLCTSMLEGSPLPPLEAAACGRAVISTECGNMQALSAGPLAWSVGNFHDRHSAEVVRRRVYDTLWNAKSWDRDRWAAQVRNARVVAEQNSWERLAPKWLEAICGD